VPRPVTASAGAGYAARATGCAATRDSP